MTVKTRKKLIEVALPLEAINDESSRRKRKAPGGYPTAIHKWWAQRPIAACRAVLFASIVDDPSSRPEEFPTAESQERERQRLFRLIEDLIKWENSNDDQVLAAAYEEIRRATGGDAPTVLDPFCGGGSIPLEAQRLGLEASGSDLNPVAVLITKALVEIPPKFASKAPVNPTSRDKLDHSATWKRAQGLAEDVRYYGRWMREESLQRIGHLYPEVELPDGRYATAAAWLWTRTVTCPNPACSAQMPLVSSFILSSKKGKAWHVRPVIHEKNVLFEVHPGTDAPRAPKTGRGATFSCLVCGQHAPESHIKAEGMAGRFGTRLMAMVADSDGGRIFLSPAAAHVETAFLAQPQWKPEADLPYDPRNVWCTQYGIRTYADLFTPRQLVALSTFSDLVGEARERVHADGGDEPYADAVATYLALAVSRVAHYGSSNCTWLPKDSAIARTFTRQALPMVWDYAEGNPFGKSSTGLAQCVDVVARCLDEAPASMESSAIQRDAVAVAGLSRTYLVCTDPPYYDNIGYADLADFFYVWLRRSLGRVYPDLFSTLLTPKSQEMVANPYRFDGNREQAQRFFEHGLKETFICMREAQDPRYPMTLFYAFKQAEAQGADGIASTGWETMLNGLLESGFAVTGTWPMRTEGDNRQINIGTNALASSILLVC